MKKTKFWRSLLLAVLTLNVFLNKKVIAQETDLSTGGFSNGTFSFPIDNGLTGIDVNNFEEDLSGLVVNSGVGDLLPPAVAELFKDLTRIVGRVETFLSELEIEVDLGELDLPNIEQAIELFESDNQIDIASDVFGSQTGSTTILDDALFKQYLKDLGNEYAQNSTLNKEGQEITAQQIEVSQETAILSNELAQNSNGQDVSQNILRNISNQLALQQQLANMSYFGLTEDKIARSLIVSMQGESLVALDKITTVRDRETAIALKSSNYYQGLLSIPAQHLIP